MRQVQEALKNIGIPVIAGIWRATSENQNPPLQYVVYSSTTTETAFQDDRPVGYRTYSFIPPTIRCRKPAGAWMRSTEWTCRDF